MFLNDTGHQQPERHKESHNYGRHEVLAGDSRSPHCDAYTNVKQYEDWE